MCSLETWYNFVWNLIHQRCGLKSHDKYDDFRLNLTKSKKDLQLDFNTNGSWRPMDLSLFTQNDLIPSPRPNINYDINKTMCNTSFNSNKKFVVWNCASAFLLYRLNLYSIKFLSFLTHVNVLKKFRTWHLTCLSQPVSTWDLCIRTWNLLVKQCLGSTSVIHIVKTITSLFC